MTRPQTYDVCTPFREGDTLDYHGASSFRCASFLANAEAFATLPDVVLRLIALCHGEPRKHP
jgi:hypothetical protein